MTKKYLIKNRLPKHKNCVHDYRFLRQQKHLYKEKHLFLFDVFYCTKCLLTNMKLPDLEGKEFNGWLDKQIETRYFKK